MFGSHSGTHSGESKFLPFSSRTQGSVCTVLLPPLLSQKSTTGNAQSPLIWDSPSQYLFSCYPEESEFAIPPCQQFKVLVLPVPAQVGRIPWCCPSPLLPPHHQHSTFQRKTIKGKALWHPGPLDPFQRCPGLFRLSG